MFVDGVTAIGKPTKEVLKVSETDPEDLAIDINIADLKPAAKATMVVELLAFYCSESDKSCKRDCTLITQPVEILE